MTTIMTMDTTIKLIKNNMFLLSPLLFLTLFSPASSGQETVIPAIIIDDQKSSENPIDQFSTFKVEKVSQQKMNDPQRQNLNDLVSDQRGVDAQVYCSNCGAKRLTINGLKGEHTSILIDGLPLHSAISSFYGVDNIPIHGLSEVQVMRGSGASLTNPEAIGGTLNLITIDPLNASHRYSSSLGVDDQLQGKSQQHSLLYTVKDDDKRWGISMGGQFSQQSTWDTDNNNIAEQPQRTNYNTFIKARILTTPKNDFTLRAGVSELEILGGHRNPSRPHQVRPLSAQESDFIDGNIEKEFTGSPDKVTDWINLKRIESAVTWTHYISDSITYSGKLGFAKQGQQSIYQHGFDYSHNDNLFTGDTYLKYLLGEKHILSVGLFFKDQRLRSASNVLFEQYPEDDPRDIKKDSFNFSSYATYFQYDYLHDSFEINLALRADYIKLSWLDLSNEIDQFIATPRLQILHNINNHLTQRLSYGLGYRSPLTFFESQHGNNESGYEVDISQLEKAHSLVYSLSYNTPDYYATTGVHYTKLKNMAYGFESFNQPIKYRNTDEQYDIWVADLLVGYKPAHWWLLESSFEYFQYEDNYKIKLPTAAIEKRVQLKSSIEHGSWKHFLTANIIGSRDLSKYGSYSEHYINRNQSSEPLLDPLLKLKKQKAPTYLTLDSSLSFTWRKELVFTFGINNIFNYTQTKQNDSPSAWHWHFNHAHYDGLHTWGPNSGRQYFATLSGDF